MNFIPKSTYTDRNDYKLVKFHNWKSLVSIYTDFGSPVESSDTERDFAFLAGRLGEPERERGFCHLPLLLGEGERERDKCCLLGIARVEEPDVGL